MSNMFNDQFTNGKIKPIPLNNNEETTNQTIRRANAQSTRSQSFQNLLTLKMGQGFHNWYERVTFKGGYHDAQFYMSH